MSVHAILIVAALVLLVALRVIMVMAPLTAKNLFGLMPKKWQLWMLGEPHDAKAPPADDVAM